MRRLIALAAAVCGLAALASQPAAAGPRPAPLAKIARPAAEPAQFRFPWEGKPKVKARRRSSKSQKPRRQSPAAARREKSNRAPKPAVAPAAPDPMDAALPPATAPAGVAAPRGATRREAEQWAMLAMAVPAPATLPLLSEDGPAPASAAVVALFAKARVGEQTTTRLSRLEPDDAEETETPDRHVPLPPVRPPQGPRQGLAPEGEGLAPEGEALAPEGVPLPPQRPGGAQTALEPQAPEPPPGPSAPDIALPVTSHEDDADCRAIESEGVVAASRLPPIEGPGACGGGPLVLLTGVKRRDGAEVKIHPAATLRCSMARELAAYLRDDVVPAAESAGLALAGLDIAGSFQCRGRNGATSGKMSEHGRANAIDLSGFVFSDGRSLGVFSSELPKPMADTVKAGACARFSTVLGPGSDGFHESHLHLDLQPRRSKTKLCQWDEPKLAKGKDEEIQGGKDGDDKTGAGKSESAKSDEGRSAAAPAETPRKSEPDARTTP